MASAPITVAFWTIRSIAWRRVSSRSEVYSWISPPTSERKKAARLPARPRLRTTRPKTWPLASTIRWPVRYGVVTRITSCLRSRAAVRSARPAEAQSPPGARVPASAGRTVDPGPTYRSIALRRLRITLRPSSTSARGRVRPGHQEARSRRQRQVLDQAPRLGDVTAGARLGGALVDEDDGRGAPDGDLLPERPDAHTQRGARRRRRAPSGA